MEKVCVLFSMFRFLFPSFHLTFVVCEQHNFICNRKSSECWWLHTIKHSTKNMKFDFEFCVGQLNSLSIEFSWLRVVCGQPTIQIFEIFNVSMQKMDAKGMKVSLLAQAQTESNLISPKYSHQTHFIAAFSFACDHSFCTFGISFIEFICNWFILHAKCD